MDYLVTAHWTAFSGEFPVREVAGTGSIEFTLTGDVCNLKGAERIAAKNVADKEGYDYRNVAATIDAIVIRPSVPGTLCKPVVTVAETEGPSYTEALLMSAGALPAYLVLALISYKVCCWIDARLKRKKED